MKRLLLTFTFILLTASLTSAQQKVAVIAVVGESIHDFGTIKEANGAVSHTFKIKNEGKAPLIISKVSASCGCTTPEYTTEPISPGKTGEIKVTFDPKGRPAPFTKTIYVYSNGYTGGYILTIKGVVEP
jgi:hypothetical protein